jgi:hypothetical protein
VLYLIVQHQLILLVVDQREDIFKLIN